MVRNGNLGEKKVVTGELKLTKELFTLFKGGLAVVNEADLNAGLVGGNQSDSKALKRKIVRRRSPLLKVCSNVPFDHHQ